jgi:thiol:disulfide interchange protein DsbC
MSKIGKLFFAIALLVSSVYALETLPKQKQDQLQKLPLFQMAQVKINKAVDAGTFYVLNVTVRGKSDKIFLTKDEKYIIPGDVISTKNGQPLEIPVDLSITKGKEVFTFGKGKDEFVLFTDPECPYCKKFESYFSQIEDKVKFKILLFPLSFHKHAKDLSIYAMSQKTNDAKVKTLLETTADTPAFKNVKYKNGQYEKLEKVLNEQMEIASKLGVRGTPTLFDKDGNKVSWAALLQKYGIVVK